MSAEDKGAAKGIISVRGLRKSFGDAAVLRGIDLEVAEGEVVSVIGPSGSGKSTLARCLCRLEHIDGGSASVCGADVQGCHKNSDIASIVGMIF